MCTFPIDKFDPPLIISTERKFERKNRSKLKKKFTRIKSAAWFRSVKIAKTWKSCSKIAAKAWWIDARRTPSRNARRINVSTYAFCKQKKKNKRIETNEDGFLLEQREPIRWNFFENVRKTMTTNYQSFVQRSILTIWMKIRIVSFRFSWILTTFLFFFYIFDRHSNNRQ